MPETQVIHWKPNQLKFCIKIGFLSPDEKVIYYSIKVAERLSPTPTKKVGGA